MTATVSNSKIFSTTMIGNGSGQTSTVGTDILRSSQVEYLKSSTVSNLGTKLPVVPSNQGKAKRR